MTTTGRTVRAAATAVVLVGLLVGSLWGQDDHFPMGPFRMYATKQRLNGRISWYAIEGVTRTGDVLFIPGADYGMRRAEVEGQTPAIRSDPSLLCLIADTRAERRPNAPEITEVRLVKYTRPLADGRPQGESTSTIVESCER